MKLTDIVNREISPEAWAEGEKIPWSDPDFSQRMLLEHLSQDHNAASRRIEIINQHVHWINTEVLNGKSTKILDLGCGPGLYTSRLARLGHICVGIDFSPASIAFARAEAQNEGRNCTYIEGDIREVELEQKFGLVMMVHGEFNVFRKTEAIEMLNKAQASITRGGALLLEVHTSEAVRNIGEQGSWWQSETSGLFSNHPHLLLKEAFWDANRGTAIERYYVVDAESGVVTRHAATVQGYTDDDYQWLLESCDFNSIRKFSSLGGDAGFKDKNYIVYKAISS